MKGNLYPTLFGVGGGGGEEDTAFLPVSMQAQQHVSIQVWVQNSLIGLMVQKIGCRLCCWRPSDDQYHKKKFCQFGVISGSGFTLFKWADNFNIASVIRKYFTLVDSKRIQAFKLQ